MLTVSGLERNGLKPYQIIIVSLRHHLLRMPTAQQLPTRLLAQSQRSIAGYN